MIVTEFKNPFVGGNIIGPNTKPSTYHATGGKRGAMDFVMSRGELMLFDHCPARWLAGFKHKDTEEMDWGSLVDALVLNKDRFWDEWAVTPAEYLAEGKKKGDPPEPKTWNWNATVCKDWRAQAEATGKQVVKREHYGMACEARDVILKDEIAAALIADSQHQVMAIGHYHDKETDIDLGFKILIDMLPSVAGRWSKAIADLKTTASCDERKWRHHVADFSLHVQAAAYLDVYTAITGEDRVEFLHVVQENYAPWHVERRMLSQEFLALGRMQYVQALRRYCQCLKNNVWPGYECREVINGWGVVAPEPWMVM